MRQIIEAAFSPQERIRRLQGLGNPIVEEIGCGCDGSIGAAIYVLRRNGKMLGKGMTVDVAIADAEHNLESWFEYSSKKDAERAAEREYKIVCRRRQA